MKDNQAFKEKVYEILKQQPKAKDSSSPGPIVMMRCFFCGDSKKDPNKTRLGFKLNYNNPDPILYNCFNCGAHGILTPNILREMGVYDMDVFSELASMNKSYTKGFHKSLGSMNKRLKNMIIPHPYATEINKLKLAYIRTRMGYDYTVEELLSYRIIFSLSQFLKVNKLEPNIDNWKVRLIDKSYIGFLSINKDRITFRSIEPNTKYRYYKYIIVDDLRNNDKMYALPGDIEALTTDSIYINIAEGAFDILGVYTHIKNKNITNNLYLANMDASYYNAIRYFLSKGVIGSNVHINIYSDNESEKQPFYFTKLYKEFKPWVGSINLYYNDIGKDFGVSKSEISVIHSKIPLR